MNSIEKRQIADFIAIWALDNARLTELMAYSIGRVCMNMAQRGEDWKHELGSIDAGHIADWLRVALINEESWLDEVDDNNRPKKLMKFGNLQDIVREADKAMLKDIQRNGNVELDDDDEDLYMDLGNGYRLVRLLTPAALDREGKQMQHCIGGGAYDGFLNGDAYIFLSLRSKANKPHATLEIRDGIVRQIQGKQNEPPLLKYAKALEPYFKKYGPYVRHSASSMGFIVSTDGDVYGLNEIPEGMTFDGDVRLVDGAVTSLPRGLTIRGSLDLTGSDIDKLPEDLIVEGDLNIDNTQIKKIPASLMLGGGLSANLAKIRSFPVGMHIPGKLHLRGAKINKLPKGFRVDGNVDIGHTSITRLPDDFHFGGDIRLNGSKIQYLPDNLTVYGSLHLIKSEIKELPRGLTVHGDLEISKTDIKSLPDRLTVGRCMFMHDCSINELPDNLKVNDVLDIRRTAITKLPENLWVGGRLYMQNTNIKDIPFSLQYIYGLYLAETLVTELPEGLKVEHILNIERTQITSLPKSIRDDVTVICNFGEMTAKQFRKRIGKAFDSSSSPKI